MAQLVGSLVTLRTEINRLFPGRDKTSDGWIGDAAHAASKSDHNADLRGLVHAIDVDRDLNSSVTMQQLCDLIVTRCRTGQEKRLTYVIFDSRIASASRGWTWRPYGGANPHDKHAHFSASDNPALERNTTTWHLEGLIDMPLTGDDGKKVWQTDIIPNPKQRGDAATNKETSAFFAVGDIWRLAYENAAAVAGLRAQLAQLAGKDFVDEPAIVAGILAGLDPAALARAVAEALPAEQAKQVVDELTARLAA